MTAVENDGTGRNTLFRNGGVVIPEAARFVLNLDYGNRKSVSTEWYFVLLLFCCCFCYCCW